MTGCSTVDMHKRHSGEKKELRLEQKSEKIELRKEHKAEMEELKGKHEKKMSKLKGKQTIEFGVLVAGKIQALKNFFK